MTPFPQHPPGNRASLAAFFAIAFAFSWTSWLAALAAARAEHQSLSILLHYLGTAGPLVAALGLLYASGGRSERRDFWQRAYEVERLRPRWLAVTLLLYPALTALAVAFDLIAGGMLPDTAILMRLVADPAALLASVGLIFILGPLLEEPGWRGYALDRLQRPLGAVVASVSLGILWATWHLPLFFLSGTYQHALGIGTPGFWLFSLTAIGGSVLITWIYRHNERSIFAAMLFHAMLNITRSALPVSDRTELFRTGFLILLALLVAVRLHRHG